MNFRTLRIIAIVRAVEIAERRFTPRTQRYCVATLIMRKNICRGRMIGSGINCFIIGGIGIGGDCERVLKSRMIRGRRGMKKGIARKCYCQL